MTRVWPALILMLATGSARAADDAHYRIGPRDVIEVQVYDEPDLSKSYEVSTGGTISANLVGTIDVVGLTTDEVAKKLTEGYLAGILNNPQVTVRVEQHHSQQVEVYGAVKKPGPYYLEGPTKLLALIGQAGWVDAQKSSNVVTLRRDDGDVLQWSLAQVMSGGDANVQVRAGDVVNIGEGEVVYVGGEVVKAGPVVYTQGLLASEALLKAGGLKETGRLRGAYIVRDGEKIPVNLRRIADGRASDVEMQPGDQLFLKESAI